MATYYKLNLFSLIGIYLSYFKRQLKYFLHIVGNSSNEKVTNDHDEEDIVVSKTSLIK